MPRKLESCPVHHFLDTGELGGGNLNAIEVARLIKQSGGTSHVWTDDGPAVEVVRADGLVVHDLPQSALRAAGKIRSRFIEWRLRKRLRTESPGIAHLSSAFLHGLTCRAFLNTGLKRVVYVQIEDTIPNWTWALRYPPDAIITCAKFLVPGVRKALPPAIRDQIPIHAIPNATDPHRFAPGDRRATKLQLGFRTDRPMILMLANLAPHKGQHVAIAAVARLRDRGIIVDCRLAGTERGNEKLHTSTLQKQIDQAGLTEQVKLLGHRTDAPELLRAADIFLLPSTNEGLPLAILEAQAVGVPVLAAPTAGIPETIEDGETGFLIPANDDAGYADKIAMLLAQPELANRICSAAMERVKREFSSAVYGQRMLSVFQELADKIDP